MCDSDSSNTDEEVELGNDDWSDIDEEWDNYLENGDEGCETQNNCLESDNDHDITKETDMYKKMVAADSAKKQFPDPSPLVISTKSQEVRLNIPVDLDIFWKIPLISYDASDTGVVKKIILIKLYNVDQFNECNAKKQQGVLTPGCSYVKQRVMNHTDIQIAEKRKFYHKSVVAYGINSKDFHKVKNTAFRNSFGLIFRICLPEEKEEESVSKKTKRLKYHEYNVKIFNTGRITFTGVKHECILKELFSRVLTILKTYSEHGEFNDCSPNLDDHKQVKILVNSNFKCGFCIHQLKLRQIIATKYKQDCIYNAGNQYTGLRSKYYYDLSKPPEEQTGKYVCKQPQAAAAASIADTLAAELTTIPDIIKKKTSKNRTSKMIPLPDHIMRVSYAVFRTGSVLVAGKCNDDILNMAYKHIANMLAEEFKYIYLGEPEIKIKKAAKKKKYIKVCSLH
jgi:TATA-box binding protein (TBP) (component of TFIID and TFIIIB)